jgi:hypothetical protein
MARPARLLGFAVLSALLVPATQFASSWQPLRAVQGEEAQTSASQSCKTHLDNSPLR